MDFFLFFILKTTVWHNGQTEIKSPTIDCTFDFDYDYVCSLAVVCGDFSFDYKIELNIKNTAFRLSVTLFNIISALHNVQMGKVVLLAQWRHLWHTMFLKLGVFVKRFYDETVQHTNLNSDSGHILHRVLHLTFFFD